MSGLQDGQRVRIVRAVDLFPLGVFAAGLLGTVQHVHVGGFEVRLDVHFDALDDWDNCLIVGGDELVTQPDDFEVVP